MKTQISSLSDIEQVALQVLDSWKIKKTLSLFDEARKFAFCVTVKQALSSEPEHLVTAELLKNFVNFIQAVVSLPINSLEKRVHIAIEERMDFLDILLAHKDLSMEERHSLVVDILFGRYETTSSLISIIVRFLSDNPKALNALKKSLRKVGGERLGCDDYKKCASLGASSMKGFT
ncbi:Cytochrome P450 protein [Dioscorea alata]|uniref:Cytochrome P450 protein n=1 Tax=Dioscorea alata TaxID=55571 RepID=A0ACB7WEL0_DIOAL|nr:Cytochrome P450 protein [Dioscorea alata]